VKLGQPLDTRLMGINDYPYTISYVIRKALQIESFNELPKKKRPPENIWDNGAELELWIENLSAGEDNTVDLIIPDWEIED
jgi:hypothetical protein